MTKCINTLTLAEAYKQCIQYIVWPQNHRVVITEDNEKVWRSRDTIVVHVDTPSNDLATLVDYYPWGPQAMEEYVAGIMGTDHRVTKDTKDDFAYSYHQRLCNYEVLQNLEVISPVDGVKRYNTRLTIVDQINEIITRLNTSPTSRRACAITWRPYDDNYTNTHSPPCLQWLKCEIVDGRLNMYTLWRSRDVLLGLGANIYAIHHLHCAIASQCGVKVGFYEDVMVDAHIYFERDVNYLKRWL